MNEDIDYTNILKRLKLTEKDLIESKKNEFNKFRRGAKIVQFILMFLGCVLVSYKSWEIGLGVLFIIWSNNISLIRIIFGKGKENIENIWKDE